MHRYKKGEYRDQFVIAYITDLDNCQSIIQWAEKFCNILQKGLILLYISDSKYNCISTSQAQQKLKTINEGLNLNYVHSYAALGGKTKEIINNLGDLLNGVMVVTQVSNDTSKTNPVSVNNLLNNFYTCRLAYFVFKKFDANNNFSDCVVTMNALKECKEKILWASYLGRFAHSITHIYYHRYADQYLQKQLNLNIGFLRKMFRKFNIETRNARSMDKYTALDVQASQYAAKNNCGICIFQTTKTKSIIELFTGLAERKVLKRMDNVPVLYLNQRDDLFVMCE
ncbi:MAG: hypothetical protein J6M30_06080 [Bacteroidales bacterium]|nr:hypothetical protein [Bacteroidales bacterium]